VTVATGVVLETGWETSTPPGDTVLRRAVLALAEEREQTALGQGGRAVRSERLSLADAGSPSPYLNSAVLLRPLAAPGGERLVEEAERFYADGTGGSWMLFSPWPTPDLAGRGWELVGHPPLMLRPLGAPRPRPRRSWRSGGSPRRAAWPSSRPPSWRATRSGSSGRPGAAACTTPTRSPVGGCAAGSGGWTAAR
jgi:hypothetical protein